MASFTAATIRSWSISTSSGSTASVELPLAGHHRRHHAAAGSGLIALALQLFLGLEHFLLHLLGLADHAVHVAAAHAAHTAASESLCHFRTP